MADHGGRDGIITAEMFGGASRDWIGPVLGLGVDWSAFSTWTGLDWSGSYRPWDIQEGTKI